MPSTQSEFDEDAVQEWRKPHHKAPWSEERPYRECPHCGRHKFRAMRQFKGGLLTKKRIKYWERCDNCKYKGDEWVEDR